MSKTEISVWNSFAIQALISTATSEFTSKQVSIKIPNSGLELWVFYTSCYSDTDVLLGNQHDLYRLASHSYRCHEVNNVLVGAVLEGKT